MTHQDRLFELLILKASRQASEEDLARLDDLIECHPELREEYEQWEAALPATREAVGLIADTHATGEALPDPVRARLMAYVRESFSQPDPVPTASQHELSWRWALIPAAGLVVIFIIASNLMNGPKNNPPSKPSPIAKVQPAPPVPPHIRVALLDVVGQTRSPDDPIRKKLQTVFSDRKIAEFDRSSQARDWLTDWPETDGPAIKILYNASSGELTLVGQVQGEEKKEVYRLDDPAELPVLVEQARTTFKQWLAEGNGK